MLASKIILTAVGVSVVIVVAVVVSGVDADVRSVDVNVGGTVVAAKSAVGSAIVDVYVVYSAVVVNDAADVVGHGEEHDLSIQVGRRKPGEVPVPEDEQPSGVPQSQLPGLGKAKKFKRLGFESRLKEFKSECNHFIFLGQNFFKIINRSALKRDQNALAHH